jgi:hypothetical protein
VFFILEAAHQPNRKVSSHPPGLNSSACLRVSCEVRVYIDPPAAYYLSVKIFRSRLKPKPPIDEVPKMTPEDSEAVERGNDEALPIAVETLKMAYSDIDASIESINSRSGVALTAVLTALAIVSIQLKPDLILPFGNYKIYVLILYSLMFGLVSIGVINLIISLQAYAVIAGYSAKDEFEFEWKKLKSDYYLKQLSNLNAAIEDKQNALNLKSGRYKLGLILSLIGIGLMLTTQFLSSVLSVMQGINKH